MSEIKKYTMSHSRASTWLECPEKEHLRYVEHVEPKEYGSSLAFGIAIDIAVSHLLKLHKEGKTQEGINSLKSIFLDDKEKGWKLSFSAPGIKFTKTDLDMSVLVSKEDKDLIEFWETSLNTKLEDAVTAKRQQEYKEMTEEEITILHHATWLSLRNKGYLMLDAFVREVLPKIKKVIAIQHKIEGTIEGDKDAKGYIDFIVEFDGHSTPVVFDLKTSAYFYDSNAVFLSPQLTLYASAVGSSLGTELAGFIVLLKSMGGTSVCEKCLYKKEKGSRFKSCNRIIPLDVDTNVGERCNGVWIEIPEANVQILVDKVPVKRQDQYLNSFVNLTTLASQGLRIQNWNSCKGKFGICDFYRLCHFSDTSDYKFADKESEERVKHRT